MLPGELPEDAPADAEGCELVCEDDEILIADPRLNIYNFEQISTIMNVQI